MVWAANFGLQALCISRLFRLSNLCEHQTNAVYGHEMIGGVASCAKWYLSLAGCGWTIQRCKRA